MLAVLGVAAVSVIVTAVEHVLPLPLPLLL
jgi:hypothetical protein